MLVNWNKLQPYQATKSKSFEQLCYQLAVRELGKMARFTPIDDSGGGDGVEFYCTFPDGREWGWQAKFYEGSVRLNESNRKAAISGSLTRALEEHPDMTRWILCLPMDFTPLERKWFEGTLLTSVPAGRTLEIVPWNESDIHAKLNELVNNGLKQAFFNEMELDREWFEARFINGFSIIKNKYDEHLYVPNEEFEYWYLNPVLCNDGFRDRISMYPKLLQNNFHKYKQPEKIYSSTEWKSVADAYRQTAKEISERIAEFMPILSERYDQLSANSVNQYRHTDHDAFIEEISKQEEGNIGRVQAFHAAQRKKEEEKQKDNDKNKYNKSDDFVLKLYDQHRSFTKLIEEIRYFIRDSAIPAVRFVSHYLGGAGTGKTNFCVAIAKEYLRNGYPFVFIPAIKLNAASALTDQILTLLDIKSSYSFGDLLDCLNALGVIHNIRVPIILDGLNESLNHHGGLNERLALDLPGIEEDINRRTNLVLITTCRPSYKKVIWKDARDDDRKFASIYGFTHIEDKRKLVRTYFNHYLIQADLSFLSLNQFSVPLYLKMYCEATNPQKLTLVQVTLGYDSVYHVLDQYIAMCDARIYERCLKAGKPPSNENKNLATTTLNKIANRLLTTPQRGLLFDEVLGIADPGGIDNYNVSVTKALLDEELLFVRDWADGKVYIHLTYDMLSGYLMGKALIEIYPDVHAFLHSEEIQKYVGEDYERLHPLHEDIMSSFYSLCPILKGIFIHDEIMDIKDIAPELFNELFVRSIQTTLLLSPVYIPSEQVTRISELADRDLKNLVKLISSAEEVFFVTDHPFNFKFWKEKLSNLAMNNRDVSWSEYLRGREDDFLTQIVFELEQLLTTHTLSDRQLGKVSLVVDYLMWSLTATHRTHTQKASDCLYQFGLQKPDLFFEAYKTCFKIDDPTVHEQLSMIAYNIVVQLCKGEYDQDRDTLSDLAEFLVNNLLTPDGTFVTSHLIIIGYAKAIVDVIRRRFAGIDLDYDRTALLGISEWGESEDLNDTQYSNGNLLIDYYFHKEKMLYLDHDGSEYNHTPQYLSVLARLRWRAYGLGYRFDLFSQIDQQIANDYRNRNGKNTIERYAGKYIGVAYLEYAGYLQQRGRLKSFGDDGNLRGFSLSFDPSKTEADGSEEENAPREPDTIGKIVTWSYLDPNTSYAKFASSKSVPDVSRFLTTDSANEKLGDWVLLNGLVHQHSRELTRQIFFKMDAVFVPAENAKEIYKSFNKQTKLGWANRSLKDISRIHEAEIPDGVLIPENDWITWYYDGAKISTRQPFIKTELYKDGKKLTTGETEIVLNETAKLLQYLSIPAERQANISSHIIKMILRPDGYEYEDVDWYDYLQQQGYEIKYKRYTKQVQQRQDMELSVFPPCINLKGKSYLCRNMIQALSLRSKVGSTDLYDSTGQLASFNQSFYISYPEQEAFTYLRRDLLNRYLTDNKLSMIWVVWGERDYYPADGDWMMHDNGRRKWTKFYDAQLYQAD